jgi:hypothetical protein
MHDVVISISDITRDLHKALTAFYHHLDLEIVHRYFYYHRLSQFHINHLEKERNI